MLELEAANVAHFDALGHNFDEHHPDAAGFADRLSRALRRVLVLDEDATSVLDYACGSGKQTFFVFPQQILPDSFFVNQRLFLFLSIGQVSRALAPYVAQLVGVDISPRMVEVYNARANTQGLEPHEMRAVGSLAELQQQQRFDLAVVRLLFLSPCNNWHFSLAFDLVLTSSYLQCSMAYHHFASIEEVTRELVAYLKPRGTLAVADILRVEADEGERPIMAKYEYMVAHTRGFAEEEMRGVFEGAGLENVAFERFASGKKEGRDVQFFLATGTKPDSES